MHFKLLYVGQVSFHLNWPSEFEIVSMNFVLIIVAVELGTFHNLTKSLVCIFHFI